eukprot:7088622-Pyramimonas_sp.AAC.1
MKPFCGRRRQPFTQASLEPSWAVSSAPWAVLGSLGSSWPALQIRWRPLGPPWASARRRSEDSEDVR